MAERTTELTPLAKMILGGTVGVLVLGGVVYGGMAYLDRHGNTPLVILKAETSPHKVAPADKGGLKINSLDSPVLSLLDKAEELEDGVEILRPPVSEPEPPPITVTADDDAATDVASSDIAETPEPSSDEAVTTTTAEKPAAPKAEVEVVSPSVETQTDDAASSESTAASETDVAASETQQITPTSETAEEDEITAAVNSLPQKRPNTPKIVATTDVNSPSYVVQFAAFKSETSAKNTAAVLSTKHKSRLDGMALGYMRWGDYWRVVAEPMPRAEANAFCSKFRSVGQDCIIKLMETPNG